MQKLEYDERNLGGRDTVRKRLRDHHASLVTMKPVLKSHIPPHPHVDAHLSPEEKKKRGAKLKNTYGEVFVSFKKVTDAKVGINCKEPKTFHLMNSLVPKHGKEMHFINQEHQLHLKSQQRKLESLGKLMHERKKNLFDPIAYPSRMLRRPPQNPKKAAKEYMFSSVLSNRPVASTFDVPKLTKYIKKQATASTLGMSRSHYMKRSQDGMGRSLRSQDGMTRSQGDMENLEENEANMQENEEVGMEENEKMENEEDAARREEFSRKKKPKLSAEEVEIPVFIFNGNGDYQKMKNKLLDLIIDNRLFKLEDYRILEKRVCDANPDLEQELIHDVFTVIQGELDS